MGPSPCLEGSYKPLIYLTYTVHLHCRRLRKFIKEPFINTYMVTDIRNAS